MSQKDTLLRAANGTRVLETLENYVRAGVATGPYQSSDTGTFVTNDRRFWDSVFEKRIPFGTSLQSIEMIVSEWIPRVPGLFWTKAAKQWRDVGRRHIERHDGASITLRPLGKSALVTGGIGTLKLAPSEQGSRLCSLITSGNVSGGIPALITEEVWTRYGLSEGTVITIRHGTWQPMASAWSSRFPSTRDIPHGYIRIDDHSAIEVLDRDYAAHVSPFSVMRYYKDDIELYDFVFASGVTTEPHLRREIGDFFEQYKEAEERHGTYLISADETQPMWESEFTSPADLAQGLSLVQRRIEDTMFSEKHTTESLLRVLAKMDVGLLKRVSNDIEISDATWFRGGSRARAAADLLARVPAAKIPQLIDAIRLINPDLLEAA